MVISDETVLNKIAGLSAELSTYSEAAKYRWDFEMYIAGLTEKLNSGEVIDQKEIDIIKSSLNLHSDQASWCLEKANYFFTRNYWFNIWVKF